MKIKINHKVDADQFYEQYTELIGFRQPDDPDRFWIVTYNNREFYSVGKHDPAYEDHPKEIKGIPVVAMPRGGAWSWHGPGQTALIMDINFARLMQEDNTRLTEKVRFSHKINNKITEIVGKMCSIDCEYNNDDPGIYTKEGAKLASLGWDVFGDTNLLYNWSFNIKVGKDFAGFKNIDVCGVKDRPMANLMPWCGDWQELQYKRFGEILLDKIIAEIYMDVEDLEICKADLHKVKLP